MGHFYHTLKLFSKNRVVAGIFFERDLLKK